MVFKQRWRPIVPDELNPVTREPRTIPGMKIFDGELAKRGFALNAMCYSFNLKENRDKFVADEEAYMARFNLTQEQKEAVRKRDVLGMLEVGGNVYYLAKLAGILGLNVQDLGALQTGQTLEDFKAGLLAHGETIGRKAA
jgi:protocatechuate 4,5-dioxygenase alpha chain